MKKLKLGVIGTGRIGKVHIATLVQSVPQAEVVAIADVNLTSANEVAKAFGITTVFDAIGNSLFSAKIRFTASLTVMSKSAFSITFRS